MKNIQQKIRKKFKKFQKYSSARDEFSSNDNKIIFLDANENPFGDGVSNRYPDPSQKKLREKLAEFRGINFDQIICSNGSDELIDLLIRIFCEPKRDSILICPPTFEMYEIAANLNDVSVEKIPLLREKKFDLDFKKIKNSNAKILFLPNPVAPTGQLFDREKLKKMVKNFGGIVVIDEAYLDFSGEKSFAEFLPDFKNLVALGTFSKFFGLAGERIGFCVADREIIDVIRAVKMPYNVSVSAQTAAINAIENLNFWREKSKILIAERENLATFLRGKNFIKTVFQSNANFIFVEVFPADNAEKLYNFLVQQKIIIRKFGENFVRFSIGTPDENSKLIQTLKTF